MDQVDNGNCVQKPYHISTLDESVANHYPHKDLKHSKDAEIKFIKIKINQNNKPGT